VSTRRTLPTRAIAIDTARPLTRCQQRQLTPRAAPPQVGRPSHPRDDDLVLAQRPHHHRASAFAPTSHCPGKHRPGHRLTFACNRLPHSDGRHDRVMAALMSANRRVVPAQPSHLFASAGIGTPGPIPPAGPGIRPPAPLPTASSGNRRTAKIRTCQHKPRAVRTAQRKSVRVGRAPQEHRGSTMDIEKSTSDLRFRRSDVV
jgi:hypothetical protein